MFSCMCAVLYCASLSFCHIFLASWWTSTDYSNRSQLNSRAIHECRSDMHWIPYIFLQLPPQKTQVLLILVRTRWTYIIFWVFHPPVFSILCHARFAPFFQWQILHSRKKFSFAATSEIWKTTAPAMYATHRQGNNKRIYQKSLVYKCYLLYVYMHSSFSASVLVLNSYIVTS